MEGMGDPLFYRLILIVFVRTALRCIRSENGANRESRTMSGDFLLAE